jgi:NSS family neurotransmitter:Na+ symporter
MPIMIAEFTVGRRAKASTGKAFGILAPGTQWKWLGRLGVLSGLLILGYYSVVAGWTLEYILTSLSNGFANKGPEDFVAIFQNFSQDPVRPIIWCLVFLFLTHFVIVKGVKDGIEKSSKVLMPVLFILILVLAVCSMSLPDASKGLEFLLKPDFSKVNADVFLGAMGQAFFSLSLGMGCLSTYASYFGSDTQMGKTALSVGVIDTMVAILAGLIIFPAAFSVGIQPDAGPSLIFITLPNVFQQAFGGVPFLAMIFSLMFYVLLALAALTSTISLHEVVTAYLNEQFGMSRGRAAVWVTGFCVVTGVLSSLSLGVWDDKFFGLGFFDLLDFVTAKLMLPLSGLLVSLFVGWYLKRSLSYEELTNYGLQKAPYFPIYMFILRYLAPIAIVLIFVNELGWLS